MRLANKLTTAVPGQTRAMLKSEAFLLLNGMPAAPPAVYQ